MEFADTNIYKIIAGYIQVSDITEFVISDNGELTHFSENKDCKNGEFSCFSFCELYNIDTKYIDGSMFGNHLRKITDISSKTPHFMQTLLSFLLKIRTNCPNININIAYLISRITDKSKETKIKFEYNNIDMTHLLYQKLLYRSSSEPDKYQLKEDICLVHNHKIKKSDFIINEPSYEFQIYNPSSDYEIYNIYDNYHNLNFVDINPYSVCLFNKYITGKYFEELINEHKDDRFMILEGEAFMPPHSIYQKNAHYEVGNNLNDFIELTKRLIKYCEINNPFYTFIRNQTTLIVRENDFYAKLINYTDNLCSKFEVNSDGIWNNFIIAGGCVFNCLNNYADQDQTILDEGDIDIFFYGAKKDQSKAFNYVLEVIESNNIIIEKIELSYNSVEITTQNYRKIQLILTDYKTPKDIIEHFDLWVSSVFYDGKHVQGNLNFLYSIKFWHEKIKGRELCPKSMLRVAKYMKKGMRLYTSKYYLSENKTITLDKHIEKSIAEQYGDVLHNKHRTIMRDGFIQTWFPSFTIKKLEKYNSEHASYDVINNSCDLLNKYVTNTLINSFCTTVKYTNRTKPEDTVKIIKQFGKFYEQITNSDDIPSIIRNHNYRNISDCIYGRNGSDTSCIDCVLDSNFNDFNRLHYLVDGYRHYIMRLTVHLFLDGVFTFDDKEILISNYNIEQANILGNLLNYIKENVHEINPNMIEMGETIKIKYSNIGDFTCERISLSGKLYIIYTINNYSRYAVENDFKIEGLFSNDI